MLKKEEKELKNSYLVLPSLVFNKSFPLFLL
jgi:hypothetical protein